MTFNANRRQCYREQLNDALTRSYELRQIASIGPSLSHFV